VLIHGRDGSYLATAGDWTDDDTRVTGILGQRDLLNWFVRCFLDAGDADILDGALIHMTQA
jgi:hypothetical protein